MWTTGSTEKKKHFNVKKTKNKNKDAIKREVILFETGPHRRKEN